MQRELHIPKSEPRISGALKNVFPSRRQGRDNGADALFVRLMSNPPTFQSVIAGAEPMMSAMSRISQRQIVSESVSLAIRDVPETDKRYMKERRGQAITLQDMFESMPDFTKAAQSDPLLKGMTTDELLASRHDVIRVLTTYTIHADAFEDSLRDIGIEDTAAYVRGMITERDLRAAALVDAAIGSWILRHVADSGLPRESILMTREGSHAQSIVKSLEGDEVVADIAINQVIVPSLDRILRMDPLARDYMLRFHKNVSRYNNVYVVHTHKDADNLKDIADYESEGYERVPLEERAVVTVRNMVPPHYLDIVPQRFEKEHAAPFMRDAVAEGKIILGMVGRLDPIKRDITVLKRLDEFISRHSQTTEGREMLQNLRIAVVARPKVLNSNIKGSEILTRYHDTYEEHMTKVNAHFKEAMGVDDDFILANRDASGRLDGMSVTDLKNQVFPFLNISMHMGQEGLNIVAQEIAIQTTFGLEEPRPNVAILTQDTGFSEKVREYDLPNFLIVDTPHDQDEVAAAILNGYKRASEIKANPGSAMIENISERLKWYFEANCSDSFYGEPLEILARLRQS